MAKANNVIRADADGIEINYGPLVLVKLGGTTVIMEDWRAEQLGLRYEVVDEIPEFISEIKLGVDFGNHEISVYVSHNRDLKTIGYMLSQLGNGYRVKVHAFARNLMVWEKGVVVSEQKPLTDFYTNLTQEQIDLTTF